MMIKLLMHEKFEWHGEKVESRKYALSPKRSLRTASSAACFTSWAIAAVSFLALSVVQVFDDGVAAAAAAAGELDFEAFGVEAAAAADDVLAVVFGGAAATATGGAGAAGAEAGTLGAAGLGPPMLREMVGAGAGASVSSGR